LRRWTNRELRSEPTDRRGRAGGILATSEGRDDRLVAIAIMSKRKLRDAV
jgi:hypothetical protein